MEIQFQSDIGKRRQMNQDYANVFVNKQGYSLAILADGMGGHLAGDVASKMAVNGLGAVWEASEISDNEKASQWMIQQIQTENEAIYQEGIKNPEMHGMGTTIVSAALLNETFTLAHVGDSRAYYIHDGKMRQLTDDHSLVNELVKSGEITEEMAAIHPQKNVLTRSVGVSGNVEVDVTHHPVEADAYLLLCSDGLTNMVSEAEILTIVAGEEPLDGKTERLISQANEAGGSDNITVLLIHFKEVDQP
ncbi:protein phosphatase [Enterococcus florum]|uniref:protein-serine/threonine phosphatase n=1 Tax=Enterococcus florum TaxID=2480627 RepID=A0A4P5PC61_9ENTE|nr:Stp1/IreP family PP2C-type Ser/Thr phosphatase [Enterococcus florum]GCF95797.1 protein phosphatase [Enterococcus florum]